jgi:hypothetical protein
LSVGIDIASYVSRGSPCADCELRSGAAVARGHRKYAQCHRFLSRIARPSVHCRSDRNRAIVCFRFGNASFPHRNESSCPVRSRIPFPSWCAWHRFSRHPLRPALASVLLCASFLFLVEESAPRSGSGPTTKFSGLRLSQTRRKTLRSPEKALPPVWEQPASRFCAQAQQGRKGNNV